jgi:hypothetical protein
MTEHLDFRAYEQTKAKLEDLERRHAVIGSRRDLSPAHREQVLRSYHEMMQQYRREIKLYEAAQQRALRQERQAVDGG